MTTQAPSDPKLAHARQQARRLEVYWKAVTYKTVIGYVLLALAIISAGLYMANPTGIRRCSRNSTRR